MAQRRREREWTVEKIRYGKAPRQYALVVSKVPTDEHSPWAVYFHGGAWTFGSPRQFLPAAHPFVAAGYRVVLPAHRRLPGRGFRGVWQDINTLFSTLRQRALFTSPPEVVAGMSAGGHLAASIGWRPEWWSAQNWSTGPQKLLLFGAVMDLDAMDHPGLFLLRGRKGHPHYQEANPAYQLRKNEALPHRHLIVHGTMDAMAPPHQMHAAREVLLQKDTQLTTHLIEGGTHLDSCRWMYRDDEVLRLVEAFLAED